MRNSYLIFEKNYEKFKEVIFKRKKIKTQFFNKMPIKLSKEIGLEIIFKVAKYEAPTLSLTKSHVTKN